MKKTVIVCDASGETSCDRLATAKCVICDADGCATHLPDTLQLLFTIQAPIDPTQSAKQIRDPVVYGVGAPICIPCGRFFRSLATQLWQRSEGKREGRPFEPRLQLFFDQLSATLKAIDAAKRLGTDLIALRKIADGEETDTEAESKPEEPRCLSPNQSPR